MIRATYELTLPMFERLGDGLSGLTVDLVDVRRRDTVRLLCWFREVDLRDIEDSLDAVSGVLEACRLASRDRDHLYRVSVDPDAPVVGLYRSVVDADGRFVDAGGCGGCWEVTVDVPTREDVSVLNDRACEEGLQPVLRSVRTSVDDPSSDSYGLTPLQRETLVTAAERGYFSVPKSVSLVDLADELGVSDQATSERLRRGLGRLVTATVVADDEETDDR